MLTLGLIMSVSTCMSNEAEKKTNWQNILLTDVDMNHKGPVAKRIS